MGLVRISTLSLAISFTCAACSDPQPPKKTVFDPMTQQLDKARAVQGTVDANSSGTRKAVDAEERGDTP
jgi:hypothetical protein